VPHFVCFFFGNFVIKLASVHSGKVQGDYDVSLEKILVFEKLHLGMSYSVLLLISPRNIGLVFASLVHVTF
jgi:hypothetical protein